MESGDIMNPARKILISLIEEISEENIPEVIDFIGYLKIKNEMMMIIE